MPAGYVTAYNVTSAPSKDFHFLTIRLAGQQKREVICFGGVFFLIPLGSPHVLRAHMGHTCGEPNEIELTIRVLMG